MIRTSPFSIRAITYISESTSKSTTPSLKSERLLGGERDERVGNVPRNSTMAAYRPSLSSPIFIADQVSLQREINSWESKFFFFTQ
jgi:hypothetical protein